MQLLWASPGRKREKKCEPCMTELNSGREAITEAVTGQSLQFVLSYLFDDPCHHSNAREQPVGQAMEIGVLTCTLRTAANHSMRLQ